MKAFLFYSRYSLSYLMALGSLLGASLGGVWTYLGVVLIFVLHPLIDNWQGPATHNPENRPPSKWADVLVISALPFMCVFLFVGVFHAMTASPFELIGLILSFGAYSGALGINTAHELIHRREKQMRGLGVGLLLLSNFGHYAIEHVFGHHKNVATPLDPASARKNEWIYTYHTRSFFGGLYGSFAFEYKRLRNKGWWQILKHRVFWYVVIQILLTFTVYALYGKIALIFWLGQSAVGILLLQTADYIEHYGLQREPRENGLYEGFKATHSWDSYHRWTNYSLINLGYHAHHHLKATLHFPELQQQDQAPRLPYGYSAMALLAFIPPVFFKVMNPLLPRNQK
ncbi:alkane 1-monooxygenase [Bdellovibrio bacteriovorus]|uniref:alkane 1-monooxygenase n=1 Tax=Bdellovibrio bacteriovorus TaxID=959 RepID=UPI0021D1A016|nr:alkane 1-monooxygenase [Bdellovibrio bacteriovorus]UXR63370.1 alkane 1-monooxygenase [Bdellovibrio bacteriovorus]